MYKITKFLLTISLGWLTACQPSSSSIEKEQVPTWLKGVWMAADTSADAANLPFISIKTLEKNSAEENNVFNLLRDKEKTYSITQGYNLEGSDLDFILKPNNRANNNQSLSVNLSTTQNKDSLYVELSDKPNSTFVYTKVKTEEPTIVYSSERAQDSVLNEFLSNSIWYAEQTENGHILQVDFSGVSLFSVLELDTIEQQYVRSSFLFEHRIVGNMCLVQRHDREPTKSSISSGYLNNVSTQIKELINSKEFQEFVHPIHHEQNFKGLLHLKNENELELRSWSNELILALKKDIKATAFYRAQKNNPDTEFYTDLVTYKISASTDSSLLTFDFFLPKKEQSIYDITYHSFVECVGGNKTKRPCMYKKCKWHGRYFPSYRNDFLLLSYKAKEDYSNYPPRFLKIIPVKPSNQAAYDSLNPGFFLTPPTTAH